MKKKLYPELLDYIFNYCGKHFCEKELKANKHFFAFSKSNSGINIAMYKFLQPKEFITTDKDVFDLVKDVFEAYKIKVATRIYHEHKNELELNLCPGRGKIASTPYAK